jgi:protein-S-isoprenylcysteine O-methyltransferase Ste14
MDRTIPQKNKKLSPFERIKNLLGAGLYLLVIGLLFESLALIIWQWVSFPISLTFKIQIAATILCLLFCLSGAVWFYFNLNLIKIHLLHGENVLITKGPFNYVRHPLYTTLLITLPPLMVIWSTDVLFLLPWILIYIVAHYVILVEEKDLLEIFGEDYKVYRRFVPALIPYKGAGGVRYRIDRHRKAPNDDENRPRPDHK